MLNYSYLSSFSSNTYVTTTSIKSEPLAVHGSLRSSTHCISLALQCSVLYHVITIDSHSPSSLPLIKMHFAEKGWAMDIVLHQGNIGYDVFLVYQGPGYICLSKLWGKLLRSYHFLLISSSLARGWLSGYQDITIPARNDNVFPERGNTKQQRTLWNLMCLF